MKVAINVAGVEDLLETLKNLETKESRKIARITLQAGLNVIGKQMREALDPKVKEAGKGVGTRVSIYRNQITRAKVGFNVGKRTSRKATFARNKTSRGGVGIGPKNVHWWLTGTTERWRYGIKSGSRTGRRRASLLKGGSNNNNNTGKMPAFQEGLTADAARAALPEVRSAMQTAGSKYVEAMAKKAMKKAARQSKKTSEEKLLTATGKG